MSEALLTIICSPALEDVLTHWLLSQENIPGFTSSKTFGHSSDTKNLTLNEQVEGRQQTVMFQIHMDTDMADTMVNLLKAEFGDAHIHYWLTPVISSGNLKNSGKE